MTPRWACSPSRNNMSLIRCHLTHTMKSITYLIFAFSVGYTAQCLAVIGGLLPGPFFVAGFAGAVYVLSQAYTSPSRRR